MGCVCSKGREDADSPGKVVRPHRRSQHSSFSHEVQETLNGQRHKPKTNGHSQVVEDSLIVAPRERSKPLHTEAVPTIMRPVVKNAEAVSVAAGWPSWLASVAGEAIKGWIPRRADSFEKLDKIGQGTYSNVYKARDLDDGSIVALKKVRFDNLEPESVRFMAREIEVLRRLDHVNVVKLRGLVTSRMSCSLYLVFEYMEHDLAGLAACPGVLFTEAQVKCYMQQLLRGLEHCHSRGVLHRDIKGSNLLLDNRGSLKIADFGLATFYNPNQNVPLTSRVVTLWYRPPELLLGATNYGVAVDLWSTGCILAELLAGKPIMPGRTEVEQLHKIFKLCGSPSEEYWRKSRLPHATIFKPQQPYKRNLLETFKDFPASSLNLLDTLLAIEPGDRGTALAALKSEFFTTKPLPCDPSSLPQYPPSKEYDAKLRDEEARRNRAMGGRARQDGSNRRASQGGGSRAGDRPARPGVPGVPADGDIGSAVPLKPKQVRPLHVSGPLPGPAGKNKSEVFGGANEHAMAFQGLGPAGMGHLPGDTRDNSPIITAAAPPSRINPHISSKSGPQPMLKPGSSGAGGPGLWSMAKQPEEDASRMMPPPAPARMMPKQAKSITVPDFALQGGYGPPPGLMADTASAALAGSGAMPTAAAYTNSRLSAGHSGELSAFRGQSLREQRDAQAQAQLNAHSQNQQQRAQAGGASALPSDRVDPYRREREDPYRLQQPPRGVVQAQAQPQQQQSQSQQQQQRALLQSQSLPSSQGPTSTSASSAQLGDDRESTGEPPNAGLPPPPWMARDAAGGQQAVRKTSGTFADKRIFEHKTWMLTTSVTPAPNGISDPLRDDGNGNVAVGSSGSSNNKVTDNSRRKWMPRFSDGFAAGDRASSQSNATGASQHINGESSSVPPTSSSGGR